MGEERRCPDEAVCSHECKVGSCYRVAYSTPLPTAGYQNGEWPGELIRRQLIEERGRSAGLEELRQQEALQRGIEHARALSVLGRDLERARRIAVMLEQENAHLLEELEWTDSAG
jgi:hypothetical protein